MKTVLAYGDSLTWGFDPETALRHDFFDRWPNVVGRALGHRVRVVSEGLNGRTTAFDDHLVAAERNGAKVLPTVLATHQPIDVLVVMLGANDLQKHTGGGRVFESRQGLERLVRIAQGFQYQEGYERPSILLVAPPPFRQTHNPDYATMFGDVIAESRRFPAEIAKIAGAYGCAMFDAGQVCETSPVDGVHLDAANTRLLGEALVEPIRDLLGLEA